MSPKHRPDLQESFSFVAPPAGPAPTPPFDPVALQRLGAQGIYLGTSSWKYRAWEGLIYRGGYESEAQFQRHSLREYTSYFPCVGVDFTYYAWPVAEMMAYLVESTPDNFRLCPKVTKRITMAQFPDLPAYGKWAGKRNPEYLDAGLFREKFLAPLSRLAGRLGVVLFEFSGPDASDLPRLRDFFSAVPRDFPYAVEVRNPDLVTPEFYSLVRELGLSPAFSSWTRMPPVEQQWAAYLAAGGAEDKTPLVGLGLLRPGRTYEEAVRLFQPYVATKDIYPEGRAALAAIANFAMNQYRKTFILASNRWEGSAPHSVGAVAGLIRP